MAIKSAVYYFLEEYNGKTDLRDGSVIAVTPQVAFSLDKYKVSYAMLDDYYDERALRAGENDFFIKQLKWIDGLDSIIKEKVEFCRTHKLDILRRVYYFPFKHIVDHTIIESYVLRQFIENAKPASIVYVYDSQKRQNPLNLFHWMDKGCNFYKELLSIMSSRYEFSISNIDIAGQKSPEKKNTCRIKNLESAYRAVKRASKSAFLALKHGKYSLLRTGGTVRNGLNVLFLHSGCQPHDFLIKNFLRREANVFVKEGSDIYLENKFFRKRVLELNNSDEDKKAIKKISDEIRDALPALYGKGRLLEWVSIECGIDVVPILKPFMEYLFKDTLVNAIAESIKLVGFYKKNKIDFVLCRAGTDEDPISGILASNCMEEVKSVCFEHSCGAPDFKLLCIAESGMFDVYFATDDLSMKYFDEEASKYNKNNCLVLQESYVFKNIKNKRDGSEKGKILYIPANHSYLRRYFNNLDYSATWYYRFQKKLVDLFAEKKDLTFIFKQAPGLVWCFESIIPYIASKGCKNIIIATGKISDYLQSAEKVIMDCPTTPLFQAAAFGVPTLALYRDYLPRWEPAFDHFSKNLQSFSKDEDAIGLINNFLSESPRNYNISLPISSGDTYETLVDIKSKKYDK